MRWPEVSISWPEIGFGMPNEHAQTPPWPVRQSGVLSGLYGAALLLRAPLLGFFLARLFGLGERVDLVDNDLAAVTGLAFVVGPARVVDAAGDHDHRALGDVLGDVLADAVEAGGTPARLPAGMVRRGRTGRGLESILG